MIKTLSPYYVTVPFVSPLTSLVCTSYTLRIFVWNGSKNATPNESTYEITKKNPAGSNANDVIDIARLINDFVIFKAQQGTGVELVNGNNNYWVKTEVLYTTSEPQDYIPQLVTIQLLFRGYGYGMEGMNPQTPADKLLLTGREFKVNRKGVFSMGIMTNEPVPPTPSLIVTNVLSQGGDTYDVSFTSNFDYPRIRVQYKKLIGDNWSLFEVSGVGQGSPFLATIPLTPSFYVRVSAYYSLQEQFIFSNEYFYNP
jgi:hypothetical protein